MQKTSLRWIGLWVALALGALNTPVAHALPRLSLFWSGATVMPTGTVGSFTGNTGWVGGGASIRLGGPRLGLSVGAIAHNRMLGTSATHLVGSAPVMLNLRLLRVFFLQAGGYVDYIFSGTVPLIGGSAMNRLDYGLKGGLGLEIPIGSLGLFVAAHYKYGLAALGQGSTPYGLNAIEYMAGLSLGGSKR